MSKTHEIQVKGSLVQSLFWASYCAYCGFIVTMLTDYGYPSATATAMMTATSVLSFIAQPVSGYICDNYLSHKKVYITLTICALPTMVLLSYLLFSPVLTLVLMLLFTIFMVQMPGLLDAWVIGLTDRYPDVNYGLCRGSSSLLYAITAQLMGVLTSASGHRVRMWLGAVLGLLSIIVAITLEEIPPRKARSAGKPAGEKPSTKETLRLMAANKTYILLLCMCFFLFMGSSCCGSFLPILTKQLGGDSGDVGTVFALVALSEVPAMFFMQKILRHIPARKVIVFAALFYFLRQILTVISPNYTMMLLVQILQGLSFAVIWPASMSYLNKIVEEKIRSTAIMSYSSVALGISSIFGNAIGTLILSISNNVRMVFIFAAVSSLLGVLLSIYGLIRKLWK